MYKEREFWEAKFVDSFVLKTKRSRSKRFLRDARKRGKFLDRLNHKADLDFRLSIKLTGLQASPENLVEAITAYSANTHCWLISDDDQLDGQLLPLVEAAEQITQVDWGTIMICPPNPIVIYRPEASEKSLFLFTK